jgi:hypothetical protein
MSSVRATEQFRSWRGAAVSFFAVTGFGGFAGLAFGIRAVAALGIAGGNLFAVADRRRFWRIALTHHRD